MFSAKLEGFKTQEQALEFIKWYEGGGEQQFWDHLHDVGMSPKDGCNIDVRHPGNTGRYYDLNDSEISAKVK